MKQLTAIGLGILAAVVAGLSVFNALRSPPEPLPCLDEVVPRHRNAVGQLSPRGLEDGGFRGSPEAVSGRRQPSLEGPYGNPP